MGTFLPQYSALNRECGTIPCLSVKVIPHILHSIISYVSYLVVSTIRELITMLGVIIEWEEVFNSGHVSRRQTALYDDCGALQLHPSVGFCIILIIPHVVSKRRIPQ